MKGWGRSRQRVRKASLLSKTLYHWLPFFFFFCYFLFLKKNSFYLSTCSPLGTGTICPPLYFSLTPVSLPT